VREWITGTRSPPLLVASFPNNSLAAERCSKMKCIEQILERFIGCVGLYPWVVGGDRHSSIHRQGLALVGRVLNVELVKSNDVDKNRYLKIDSISLLAASQAIHIFKSSIYQWNDQWCE
jgi:hypothetical protein